jgi:hypothetical protein
MFAFQSNVYGKAAKLSKDELRNINQGAIVNINFTGGQGVQGTVISNDKNEIVVQPSGAGRMHVPYGIVKDASLLGQTSLIVDKKLPAKPKKQIQPGYYAEIKTKDNMTFTGLVVSNKEGEIVLDTGFNKTTVPHSAIKETYQNYTMTESQFAGLTGKKGKSSAAPQVADEQDK